MGQLKWGGKTFYPQAPKPIKSDINELMKPLSEKVDKGNVWGSIIMHVPEESAVPVSPTPTPSVTPTMTVTPSSSLTPTPSVTATLTPTPTITPTISLTPSITPTLTRTPTPTSTPLPDSDATAYLNKVVSTGGTLNSTISAATYTMFGSLKSNNLWDKIFAFYPHVGGTSASHGVNGKSPNNNPLTWAGTWTYSNAGGSTPNGVNGTYGRLPSPATFGTQNDIAAGCYLLTNSTSGTKVDMGLYVGSSGYRFRIAPYLNSSFRPSFAISTTGGTSSTDNSVSDGFYVGSRTSSSIQSLYKNGSLLLSGGTNVISTPPSNSELMIAGEHEPGTQISSPSDRAHGWTFVGSGLTASEVSTLSTIVNTFQTSLSRNVY